MLLCLAGVLAGECSGQIRKAPRTLLLRHRSPMRNTHHTLPLLTTCITPQPAPPPCCPVHPTAAAAAAIPLPGPAFGKHANPVPPGVLDWQPRPLEVRPESQTSLRVGACVLRQSRHTWGAKDRSIEQQKSYTHKGLPIFFSSCQQRRVPWRPTHVSRMLCVCLMVASREQVGVRLCLIFVCVGEGAVAAVDLGCPAQTHLCTLLTVCHTHAHRLTHDRAHVLLSCCPVLPCVMHTFIHTSLQNTLNPQSLLL